MQQRRAAIVLAALALAEAVPIVESLPGVHIIGFWPLRHIFTVHLNRSALFLAVVSGITEELFFRAAVMDGFAHLGATAIGQIAISSLIFGVVHVVWIGFAGPAA